MVASASLESCVTCHDGKQDGGRFDPATYIPKVLHPNLP
jgi:cytochrome c553